MFTPTDKMNRETLKTSIQKIRDIVPDLTEGEGGFHAALALVVGEMIEYIDRDPRNARIYLHIVEFVLEAGDVISGEQFKRIANALGRKTSDPRWN